MKIGILYICTGKYEIFWKDFYLSCEKYFIPEAEKHYFVFTDALKIDFEEDNSRIHKIYQNNLGWPHNTLKRYEMFLKIEEELRKFDYLLFLNADLIFLKHIPKEDFIPENGQLLVACKHPGYFNKNRSKFDYEKNKKSLAYINKNEGKYYFAGGINGGETSSFIRAMKVLNSNIDNDLKNNIIAKWHDESHWNKYLSDKLEQVKILEPSFLYPESSNLSFDKVIMIRDKRKYFEYTSVGKNIKNNFMEKIKNSLKKIHIIRTSRIWLLTGKWLRRINFLRTIYRNKKMEALLAFRNNDKELKYINKEINKYCKKGVCNFGQLLIARSSVSIDNFFNVLLPHSQNIQYTDTEIEKFYKSLQQKYKTLIYWKENIGTREPDYKGAHLISHGFTYLMNEVNINIDDVVFDIGAAPGDFSALSVTKGASKVYAFEPEKIQTNVLEKINKLNGNKIDIIEKYVDEKSSGQTTTIDDFVKENNINEVNFIKMDIEGAEPNALRGAKNTLKNHKPKLAVCTYHNLNDEADIKNAIINANPNYDFYIKKGIIYAY